MRYQLRVFAKNCAVVLGMVLALTAGCAAVAGVIFLCGLYPRLFIPALVLGLTAVLAAILTLDNPFNFR
jgi:hypothetical protein